MPLWHVKQNDARPQARPRHGRAAGEAEQEDLRGNVLYKILQFLDLPDAALAEKMVAQIKELKKL